MPSAPRLRFAPSPTGYLHVGGARTALFNWLFARKTGGEFLLRIEDTDRERSKPEHVDVILDGLAWLGLSIDEDIVFQGAGLTRHQALADRLLGEGAAYQHEGAIRFRMPPGAIAWDDAVYGHISFQASDIQDWIILRSDRTPTYNFTVVADDLEMRITHVMRGDDHISNTPKQIAVYRALGAEPPTFVHLPMIHGPDGRKLSKRHGATAVADYRIEGILPGAMRNFLALLGWNPGDEREVFFELDELVQAFSIERIQTKAAVFDVTKLEWMNGQYLSQAPPEELLELVRDELLLRYRLDAGKMDLARLTRCLEVTRERARTTNDLAYRVAVRHDSSFVVRENKANQYVAKDPAEFRANLTAALDLLRNLEQPQWQPDALEAALRGLGDRLGVGPGKVFQPIRIALTGGLVSEPVNVLLEVVGKAESLKRIEEELSRLPDPV